MAYHSVSYVFGAIGPPGGPYDVAFGTEGPGELRGGLGDDLLASEGPGASGPRTTSRTASTGARATTTSTR